MKNKEGYPDPTCGEALARACRKQRYKFRPLAYIASPYRGDEEANIRKAQFYCRFATECGYIPIAPHIYFTQFLRDEVPKERGLAIFMNSVLLGKCHELWVFGDTISEGMKAEIKLAKKAHKRIRYFNAETYQEVEEPCQSEKA